MREEVLDLLAHIQDLEQLRDRRYLALLILSPMRREEVLGVQMQDIDITNKLIKVRQVVTFKGNIPVVDDPKTEAGRRIIPISQVLLSLLEISAEDLDNKAQYLVGSTDNPNIPVSQQTVKRMWERISKTINVYGKTPHCTRHTYATFGQRAGIPEKTMQTIGGWADQDTLRNIYTHTQAEDIELARKQIESMYS